MERAQGHHTHKNALLSSSLPPVVPVFAEKTRKQRFSQDASTRTKTTEFLQRL